MSVLSQLKKLFVLPLSRTVPTVNVGSIDSWRIVDPGQKKLFVISAGVGHNITFEQDLAARWAAKIVLLDPTPTALNTIERLDKSKSIKFMPVGLNADDGAAKFARPKREAEGSFTVAATDDENAVVFECLSLKTLLQQYGHNEIDILKMDIEGFEYSVLSAMLVEGIKVRQLCVEIHIQRGSGINAHYTDAIRLILRLHWAGYRIVYNKAMDFTFCHRSLLA